MNFQTVYLIHSSIHQNIDISSKLLCGGEGETETGLNVETFLKRKFHISSQISLSKAQKKNN